jgi:hypothetical protein
MCLTIIIIADPAGDMNWFWIRHVGTPTGKFLGKYLIKNNNNNKKHETGITFIGLALYIII